MKAQKCVARKAFWIILGLSSVKNKGRINYIYDLKREEYPISYFYKAFILKPEMHKQHIFLHYVHMYMITTIN